MNGGWVQDEVSMSCTGYTTELYEMELVQDEVSMRWSGYRKKVSFISIERPDSWDDCCVSNLLTLFGGTKF